MSGKEVMGREFWRFPFQVHLVSVMTALLLFSGLAISLLSYSQISTIVDRNQTQAFEQVGRSTVAELEGIVFSARDMVESLSAMDLKSVVFGPGERDWLPMLCAGLKQQRGLSAIYFGYPNGDFYLVRPLTSEAIRQALQAPVGARLLVTKLLNGESLQTFYDDSLNPLDDPIDRDYQLVVTERPWYRLAIQQSHLVATQPYVFYTTKEPGVTLAKANANLGVVVGADITLRSVSESLSKNLLSASSQLVMFDQDFSVLAHQDLRWIERHLERQGEQVILPRLNREGQGVLSRLVDHQSGQAGQSFSMQWQGEEWIGQVINLDLGVASDQKPASIDRMYLGLATPEDEILQEARAMRTQSGLLSLAIVLLSLPVAWLISRLVAQPLRELMGQSEAIMSFDFEPTKRVRSVVLEVHQLSRITEQLKLTIKQFTEVSTMLGEEDNFERLLELSLQEQLRILEMEHCALWLKQGEHFELKKQLGQSALSMPEQFAADSEQSGLVEKLLGAAPSLKTQYQQLEQGDKSASLVITPLLNRERQLLGIICASSEHSQVVAPRVLSFVDALSSVASVAIENRHLIEAQKNLLEAFIKLTASAIDAKSPYTGGHCQRVPELTKLLAKAAEQQQQGPFAAFSMNEAEWEQLHIASWLHDCGKVTTPEYVVDKATKLETIYDRIHEVRTRFEVLKRDAEIAHWQHVAKGLSEAELQHAEQHLASQLAELDEEFAFVAKCNIGGEFMESADIARLQDIAKRTWSRTLDDRLGISHLEAARREQGEQQLPIQEPLLADKAQHLIPREGGHDLGEDNPWGFKLKVPEYQYNRGELYNLGIKRGTLTEEERFKINDHIVQTIIMLEQLPFPEHLQAVPDIAGGHHEKMDGTGYPRCLVKEQMPVTARMMALADIFEALTAADRPYKKGKTLSQALKIMSFMVKDQHIDGELFELFIRSEVYLDYAQRFLSQAQIDQVSVEDYL